MAANPRQVISDVDVEWDGGTTHVISGTIVDIPAGSALEAAYGGDVNLLSMTSQDTTDVAKRRRPGRHERRMSSPPPVLYAATSELRLVLDGTDAGTGTAAQLTDAQLTLALQAASDRVAMFAGVAYDPSVAPPMVHDLTLDLASWWATTYYLKHKDMGPNHPVVLRYTEAMKILDQVRQGVVYLDSSVSAAASATIINKIPNIFTGDDSNTAVDPGSGTLYASTPPDMWGPLPAVLEAGQWVEYQG